MRWANILLRKLSKLARLYEIYLLLVCINNSAREIQNENEYEKGKQIKMKSFFWDKHRKWKNVMSKRKFIY